MALAGAALESMHQWCTSTDWGEASKRSPFGVSFGKAAWKRTAILHFEVGYPQGMPVIKTVDIT